MTKEKYEERVFLIISVIRLLSYSNFKFTSLLSMWKTAQIVASVERDGGAISDNKIYEYYLNREED